ncbi:MAG: hypothetical protein JWO30_3163 [Fibrobacteres bacterium]|nr:hypothetical protein [Fibrobacterota bacterium]
MGIKARPKPAPAAHSAASPAKALADTILLSQTVQTIPAGDPGTFMGTLEGVRCFNCAPDMVLLNLGDSATGQAAILALRIEIWNAIERPVKDRRMYDHDNRCFYFGYKDTDTAFVGGEWSEIRVRDLPCYPYTQRTILADLSAAKTPRAPDPQAVPQAQASAPDKQSPTGPGSAEGAESGRSALHEDGE